MKDHEIIDEIFKIGELTFSEEEMYFLHKINIERRKRKKQWTEAFDYIALGIYIGVKIAEKSCSDHDLNFE
jgi:hypothetical protein